MVMEQDTTLQSAIFHHTADPDDSFDPIVSQNLEIGPTEFDSRLGQMSVIEAVYIKCSKLFKDHGRAVFLWHSAL